MQTNKKIKRILNVDINPRSLKIYEHILSSIILNKSKNDFRSFFFLVFNDFPLPHIHVAKHSQNSSKLPVVSIIIIIIIITSVYIISLMLYKKSIRDQRHVDEHGISPLNL